MGMLSARLKLEALDESERLWVSAVIQSYLVDHRSI